MRCLKPITLLVLCSLLCACSDYQEGYKDGQAKGYEAGLEEGQLKGYAAGYKEGKGLGDNEGYARGFAAARLPPDISTSGDKWRQGFNRAMPFLPFILIMSNLFLLLIDTIRGGIGFGERFGRSLLVPIPPIFLFWAVEDYRGSIKSTLLDYLLQPRSTGGYLLLIASTALMFGVFFGLLKLCERASGHLVPSLLVIVISSLLALLGPFLWALMMVPNVEGCRVMDVVIGIVLGGLASTSLILQSRYLRFDFPLGLSGIFERLSMKQDVKEPPNPAAPADQKAPLSGR